MVFDQLKKINELRKLQDSFKKEKITKENSGVSVIMNGNFEVEAISLNPALSTEDQQKILIKCLNDAREEIQKSLAKKMMASGVGL